jgi:NADH-quinone oxidoreductase subunit N
MLFAIIPKVSFVLLFVKFYFLFLQYCSLLNYFIFFLAFCSIIFSTVVLLYELKLKRLLAYSSMNSMSHVVLSVCLGTVDGIVSGLFYLVIYLLLSALFFALVIYLELREKEIILSKVQDFVWVSNLNFFLSLLVISIFFSMLGIPPFVGFFSKLFIFYSLVNNGYKILAIFIFLLNVVSAIFYLRLIRFIEFNDYDNNYLGRKKLFTKSIALFFCVVFFLNIFFFFFFDVLLQFFYSLVLNSFFV